ncbi:MAG: selenium-binding protein, partial [bacterium]
DKTGAANEQFVRAFAWDGKTLAPLFSVDFNAEKLGRPHIMRFGQEGFWVSQKATPPAVGE